MNILAFDTCLGAVSAAVQWRNGEGRWKLEEAYEERTTGHAERLFPMISEVMEKAGLTFQAIDRIAVTIGPGTFTGARVGVAAARAFALSTGKPVVTATSLATIAHAADLQLTAERASRPLAVAVAARGGMVYFQLFADRAESAGEACLMTPQEAADTLARRTVLAVGSGAAAVAAAAGDHVHARLPDLQPHARSLAMLAPVLLPVEQILPLYLRPPDAKPQADKTLPRAPP